MPATRTWFSSMNLLTGIFSIGALTKENCPENFEQYSLLFAPQVPEIEHHC